MLFGCPVGYGRNGKRSRLDEIEMGPNDEIGAANYMTPELVVKAAGLVKTGKTYTLGFPVDSKMPAYPPARLQDHCRSARSGRHSRSWTQQDHL